MLREWLKERQGDPTTRCSPAGEEATQPRHGSRLVTKHAATAATDCPSLRTKRVTPHVLRHTNAMLLRAQNIDIPTIALWLGHESTQSTEIYLHADNKLKQEAIDRTAPTGTPPGRYRPPDTLLAFLEGL